MQLAYKGTDYSGSQIQKNGITIQELLNRALIKLFASEKIKTIFAGRTDAGVHAIGQCLTVRVKHKIPVANVRRALNSMLPPTIRVVEADYKPLSLQAQFSAIRRSYIYSIYCGKLVPLYLADFVWALDERIKIDLSKMRLAAKLLIGTHDFSAVCAANSSTENKVRTVYSSKLKVRSVPAWPGRTEKSGKLISYYIEADGFLYHMVRNIVSALVDIGSGLMTIAEFKKVMAGKTRTKLRSVTAPAKGLVLEEVSY